MVNYKVEKLGALEIGIPLKAVSELSCVWMGGNAAAQHLLRAISFWPWRADGPFQHFISLFGKLYVNVWKG